MMLRGYTKKGGFIYGVMLFIAVISSSFLSAQTPFSDKIIGNWISPDKDLIISCYRVNNLYYGKVVWFKKYYDNTPDDKNGIPENKWLNAVVMNKFSFSEDEWNNGTIWNLKTGKVYDAYIKLINGGTLQVTGFIFWRIFSETMLFSKYTKAELPHQE